MEIHDEPDAKLGRGNCSMILRRMGGNHAIPSRPVPKSEDEMFCRYFPSFCIAEPRRQRIFENETNSHDKT